MQRVSGHYRHSRKWALAMTAGALVTFLSSHVEPVDVRGTSSRVIHIGVPGLSLAMAAFEDSVREWSVLRPTIDNQKFEEIKLVAGVSVLPVIQSWISPVQSAELDLTQWLANVPAGGRLRVVEHKPVLQQLKGLTIRQPVEVETVQLENLAQHSSERQVANQGLVREFAHFDLTQPDVSTQAAALVGKELARRREMNPAQRVLPSAKGGAVLVATTTPSPSAPFAMPTQPGEAKSLPTNVQSPSISWSQAQRSEAQIGRSELSGNIEIRGGLALTGPEDELVVYRSHLGRRIESGKVSAEDGRFELAAQNLTGELVGELRVGKGEVIGRGVLNLDRLVANQNHPRVENLKLVLMPAAKGAQVEVLSAYSYGDQKQNVTNAMVTLEAAGTRLKSDSSGTIFSEGGLEDGSTYLARASAQNHWGTLVVGLAGEQTRAQLFPNRMMEALLNLTLGANRKLAHQSGVIWGRIIRDGKPVSGARVELAGSQGQQPVYFNSLMLPDKMAEATGENGLFAFVWVTPGLHSVRVSVANGVVPAQVIPVETGHVSNLEFNLSSPGQLPLELYDPFDGGREIQAMLRVAGDETSEIEVQGRGHLRFMGLGANVLFEADAGEMYELVRFEISRATQAVRAPMLRRDWLQALAARRRVNLDTGVGLIVGFLDEGFVVRVDGDSENSSATPEVVYFNPRGEALFSEEGVPGGGFAIYNVPPGLRTVSIQTASGRRVYTQVVASEPGLVNLVLRP